MNKQDIGYNNSSINEDIGILHFLHAPGKRSMKIVSVLSCPKQPLMRVAARMKHLITDSINANET